MKKLLTSLVFLLTLSSCQFSAQINGDIKADSNFAKIPGKIAEFHTCLATESVTSCESFLAQDDDVISGIQAVKDILPQIPEYVKDFNDITWDEPKGKESVEAGEPLYVITGKTTLKSTKETMYLRYRLVQQDNDLKIYGLLFRGTPLEATIE